MNNNDSDHHATNPRSPVPEPRIQDIVCHPRINVPEPGLAGDRGDDTPVVMDGARRPDHLPPSALRPGQPCILAPRGPPLHASGEVGAEARPGPGPRAGTPWPGELPAPTRGGGGGGGYGAVSAVSHTDAMRRRFSRRNFLNGRSANMAGNKLKVELIGLMWDLGRLLLSYVLLSQSCRKSSESWHQAPQCPPSSHVSQRF